MACMPASPSARAFSPRARMPGRAVSGGHSSGPKSARLRTSRGAATARWNATIVPSECAATCTRSKPSAAHTRCIACTKRSIESGPSTRCERPEPGRSGRIVRWRFSAGSTGVHTLEVPPRPWIMSTASPLPSVSTAMRSTNCVVTRGPAPSSRGGPAEAPARRPLLGILVEHPVLHDAEQPRAVLQHRDVGQRIAVHQHKIGQGAFLELAELGGAHHYLPPALPCGPERLHRREAEVLHEVLEV